MKRSKIIEKIIVCFLLCYSLIFTFTIHIKDVCAHDFSNQLYVAINTQDPSIESSNNKQTDEISEQEVPQAILEEEVGSFSLINLTLVVLTTIISLLIVFKKKQKRDENYKHDFVDLISLMFAITSIMIFVFNENIMGLMVLLNQWTILMTLLFTMQLFMLLHYGNFHSKKKHEEKMSKNVLD